MSTNHNVTFILGGVSFEIPSGYVVSEESRTALVMNQLPPDSVRESLPSQIITSSLTVELLFTSGSDFFLNQYNLFKGAIQMLSLLQTLENYPDNLRFASYIGLNEFMPKGQLQSFLFSSKPNSSNVVHASLTFESIYRKSSGNCVGNPQDMEIPAPEGKRSVF